MIEAVLFDWGHTLSAQREYDLLDMWRAAARVLSPQDPEPLAHRLLAAEQAWWHHRIVERGGDVSGTTAELMRSVVPEGPVQEAIDAYLAAWEATIDHEPIAAQVLRGCRERGWKTGLLSNTHWPSSLPDRWLDEAGLLELLDARLYTSDLRHMKPHREAFGALLQAVDVDAAHAVFVGDRPRDDIHGAQQAGMRAVHLTGRPVEDYAVQAEASLPSLDGLLDVLDGWSA